MTASNDNRKTGRLALDVLVILLAIGALAWITVISIILAVLA